LSDEGRFVEIDQPGAELECVHLEVGVVLAVGDSGLDRVRNVWTGDDQPARLTRPHDCIPDPGRAGRAERKDLVAELSAPSGAGDDHVVVGDDGRHAVVVGEAGDGVSDQPVQHIA